MVKTRATEQTESMQYKIGELGRALRQAYQAKCWQITKVSGYPRGVIVGFEISSCVLPYLNNSSFVGDRSCIDDALNPSRC